MDLLERLHRSLSDRYSLEREIDRGGMAVVYLAEDLKHHRKVAIKVLSPALASTLATRRFLREIEVTGRLQHPHILTLIDSGEADGLPYYVMPFVEGQSLEASLRRDGALPVPEAVRIAAEVADALASAHERGVIHRDLKPGNLLLSGGHAIVADFGIAAAIDEAVVDRLTETGISLGSPTYMSPEQASGDVALDGRTDIYALGCVLYEMLSGRPAFEGSLQTVIAQKVLGSVRPLREMRPDIPAPVERVVMRALATSPDERFASAEEFRQALLDTLPRSELARPRRRWWAAGVAAFMLVAVVAVVATERVRSEGERALWAERTRAQVEDLVDSGGYTEALALVEELEAVFPEDTVLARLLPRFTFTLPIRTDPPGARVYLQSMEGPEDEWEYIGETPVEDFRLAGRTNVIEGIGAISFEDHAYRIRLELEGHHPRELMPRAILGAANVGVPPMAVVKLDPIDPALEGMVRIPGFTRDGVEYGDFFMDRHEVTNREFKEFVDAGGYQSPEHWVHPFEDDGKELAFEEAMDRFEDQTGRPGPATWRLGTFPDGQSDYPVGGVSWYEAAAYARWAGKELPPTALWNGARRHAWNDSYVVVQRSNFDGVGPRPVGQNRAMTSLGVYDLWGNVREWCYNEIVGGGRATVGGAWTDAPFLAGWTIPKSALDRDPTHGFRLIRTAEEESESGALKRPVLGTMLRDYQTERPASDAEFEIFKRLYEYDPVPLEATVDRTDSFEHWTREVVSYNLPYGGRGGAAVYLPHARSLPVQPVIYWGHGGILRMTSVEQAWVSGFDFVLRSGRAVVMPILAGTMGRADPRPPETQGREMPTGPSDRAHRDVFVQWVKDVRAAIDYLETRPDVDAANVGYLGLSFGGWSAAAVLAVEPRIDAAVLSGGGLAGAGPGLPEADPFNFVPRVRQPILMINGRYDIVFPYETSTRPMFELLGTPAEDKFHHLSPASHVVPADELITGTLDWFDRYLGVPGGA